MDLLIASSWGSGMHRSEISVFNVKTKQSTIICTSIESGNTDSGNDWFIATQSPSSYTGDPEEIPIYYVVYSAEMKNGNSLVDLSYLAKSCVGSIDLEDGTPVFHLDNGIFIHAAVPRHVETVVLMTRTERKQS